MSLFQQTKEHILPLPPLRSWEEFEAGKGASASEKGQWLESHQKTGEVGFPQGKSSCAHPARGLCVLRDVTLWSGRFRRGVPFAFPAAQGSPPVMPLCSPGSASHTRHPPATSAGCQLSLVRGNPPCGPFRGSGKAVSCSWGVAAAPVHHGKLPASSESCARRFLFSRALVTQPLLVLRKEELR